jgi:hypothetical protein
VALCGGDAASLCLEKQRAFLARGRTSMKFLRRAWVKLWVNEWFDRTTRGDRHVGYPLRAFSALDAVAEIDLFDAAVQS